jgi:diguanylate cyclase (GGDEF)-like protein
LKSNARLWIEVPPIAAHSNPGLHGMGFDLTAPTELDEKAVHAEESRQIDELLERGASLLRFPPSLEDRFQQECAEQRLRSILQNGILVSVIFNWMLWSDWLMVPDVFDLGLKLRLFIFTPVTIAGILLVTLLRSPLLREWMTFVWGLAASAINVYVCISSRDVMAGPYLVALVPIIMYANSVARMRFVQSLAMDGVVIAAFFWAWHHTPEAPLAIMVPATLTLLSAATFTLYGCYVQERDERQNWLLLLRESLLLENLEHANAHLDAVSKSDMLTEVSNRRHFDEFLQQVWDRAQVDGSEISLMMIDVDHFKAYNDRYGHPEGDECLKEVAATLKRRLRRPGDLIARFGGEEFIAILAGTPLTTAASAAERVRKGVEAMNRLHATSSTDSVVTVSIGVACLRPNTPHASPAQLIAAADEALYQAKSRGRNRVFAFATND